MFAGCTGSTRIQQTHKLLGTEHATLTSSFPSQPSRLGGPAVKDCILTQRFNLLSHLVELQPPFDATIFF